MANEAVCIEKPTKYARYTVSNGIGVAKGTILALTSPNFASACTADNDVVAGIAWMEKVASDGSTQISAALDGVWTVYASSVAGQGVTVGHDVVISGPNLIGPYTTLDDEKGLVLGKALETGTAGATVKVRVGVR